MTDSTQYRNQTIVQGVKVASWIHRWSSAQLHDPRQGVSEHVDKIKQCRGVWAVAQLIGAMDQDLVIGPVIKAYDQWALELTGLYAYLLKGSDNPFPASFGTIGEHLIPSHEEATEVSASPDFLHRLIRSTEDILVESAIRADFNTEITWLTREVELLEAAFVSSPDEAVALEVMLSKARLNLSVGEGREEYQGKFLSCLETFKSFVQAALDATAEVVPDAETSS